jgi:group II intron reverse transcriptase/maturase
VGAKGHSQLLLVFFNLYKVKSEWKPLSITDTLANFLWEVTPMVTKHSQIKSESDFKVYANEAYKLTKECIENNQFPKFKNLLEIAASDVSIHLAIEKLEKNHGSDTPGVDGITLRNVLERNYQEVMDMVHRMFKHYEPNLVRRVEIPKPGKTEKRPLGIPAIADRIIQQCIKQTLEPIMEAQFFRHSYGFRPMRSAHHAIERVKFLGYNTQYNWVVEGDIKSFFDNVDHRILLKRLWHMGVRDQRILMIIKAMLKSGVMKDGMIFDTVTGTPQGGIISPLLANVYLHAMDEWVTREWEDKKTKYEFSTDRNRFQSLNRFSKLKPAYLVRYADDCAPRRHCSCDRNCRMNSAMLYRR